MTNAPEMRALDPCPFCGATLEIRSGANPYGRHDKDSDCIMAGRAINIPSDVASWNRRALSAHSDGAVAEPETINKAADDIAEAVLGSDLLDHALSINEQEQLRNDIHIEATRVIKHMRASPINPVPAGVGPFARRPLTSAWLGYWPGAGSIDSVTKVTRFEHQAKAWREEGAEVTELVERSTCILRQAPDAAQVAYGALWWFQSSTPALHDARKHLLQTIGGQGSAEQRAAIAWALGQFREPFNLDSTESANAWAEAPDAEQGAGE